MTELASFFIAIIMMVNSGGELKDIYPEKLTHIEVPKVNPIELNCLAKNIYYEASGEEQSGKLAVGFVTINRAKMRGYPNSICGVIKQREIYEGKPSCQFAWYCNNGVNKLQYTPDNAAFKQSKHLAKLILEKKIDNWMPRVVSFHIRGSNPPWAKHGNLALYTTIGHHVFYSKR